MSRRVELPPILVALAGLAGACDFTPGRFNRDDAAIATDDTGDSMTDPVDVLVDVAVDVPVDTPPPPTQFVRRIDLDDTKITGAPHTDFPVLVALGTTWLRSQAFGGDVERDDGFDIYFSSDQAGAARLAHEVELYASDTGTLIAWVKIPALQPTTTFFLHYGSDTISTDQQNVAAVWTGSYALVMHLDAIGDATGQTTSFNSVTSGAMMGRIDQARAFDGDDDRIDAGSAGAIDNIFTAGGTVEGWIYPDAFGEGGFGRLAEKSDMGGWLLGLNNTDVTSSIGFIHGSASSTQGWWVAANNSIALNTWQHVAIVYNKDSSGNDAQFIINGASVGVTRLNTPTGVGDSDASSTLLIGNRANLDRTFDGLLDEIRLSSVSRSLEWLATQYRNTSDPATFYTVSAPL